MSSNSHVLAEDAMLIETEVRDSQVLDWLCRQHDSLAIDVEFSQRTSEKDYSALPLHIQSFTKPKVMKTIPKDSSTNVDILEGESLQSNSQESFIKKQIQSDLSNESKSVTSSSSRAGEWYPRDLARNSVVKGKTKGMNQPITFLEDSNALLQNHDINGLWRQFEEQGYLYFRDFLDRDEVLRARKVVLDTLRDMGHIDRDDKALSPKGWTIGCMDGVMIGGTEKYSDGSKDHRWKKICQGDIMSSVCSNERISKVLQMLRIGMERKLKMDCSAREFHQNFGFLRVKGNKEYTAEHADVFYFRNETEMFNYEPRICYLNNNKHGRYCEVCRRTTRDDAAMYRCEECQRFYHVLCVRSRNTVSTSSGSVEAPKRGFVWHCADCLPQHNFGTCWIPLGDVEVEEGVLAVMPGSSNLPNFYDYIPNSQLPRTYYGHAKGRTWCTGPYTAGDIVFFDSRLIHCTSSNRRDSYRLSIDVRWDIVPLRDNVWKTDVGKFVEKYTTKTPPIITVLDTRGSGAGAGAGGGGGGSGGGSSSSAKVGGSGSTSAAKRQHADDSDSDDTPDHHAAEFENTSDSDEDEEGPVNAKQKKRRREEKAEQKKGGAQKNYAWDGSKYAVGKSAASSSSSSNSNGGGVSGKGKASELMPPSNRQKRKPDKPVHRTIRV